MTDSAFKPLGTSPEMKAKSKQKALRQTEERAYDMAYAAVRKKAAQEKGAADGAAAAGITDPAVERARQRALGVAQPVAPAPTPKPSLPTPSGRTVKMPDGTVVPEEFYDLKPDDQRRMLELIKQKEADKADESLTLRMVKQVMDLLDRKEAKWSKERSELMEVIAGLSARVAGVEEQDRTLEVQRSDELAEQLARLGESVVGASAVEASLRNQTAASQVELDQQRDEHRDRLAATEKVMGDHEARLRTNNQLFGERSAAVETQVAALEQNVAKAEVDQTDIDNDIKRNKQTLSAISGIDLQNEIDSSVRKSFDAQLEPSMTELVQRKYVLLAPTSGSDGEQPRDDLTPPIAKPFLTEQVGDNATERAVNRALKRSKRTTA